MADLDAASARSRRRVLHALALAAVATAAFLAGVLSERLRFDVERREMLRRYDQALREHRQQIIESEQHSRHSRSGAAPAR